MRSRYAVAGLAVLGVALAGWAALAQPDLNKPPAGDAPPGVSPPPGVAPGPAGQPPSVPSQPSEPSPVQPAAPVQQTTPPAAPAEPRGPEVAVPANQPSGGKQEPAVSIEWLGPQTVRLGQPVEYTLPVRNVCAIPVQQVLVRVRLPAGMSAVATEPKAVAENNVLVWDLGTLMPRQERALQLRVITDAKGDLAPHAWVTFTGASVLAVRVREPKLVLRAAAPERVLVGDAAAFTFTVSNPGDGVAEQVKLTAALSDGLENSRGARVPFDVGSLAPGESRSVQVLCAARAGGDQTCEAVAEADGGLKAIDKVRVNVVVPRLELQAGGPTLRYLDRRALYTFKVTNPGDAAATNVTLTDVVPAGFKVLAASDGGRHDYATRAVSWSLGEIGPGQSREVKLEVQAATLGEHTHQVSAQAARGLRVTNELTTHVEGLSALLLEVVDTEDPVEAGGETAYEVRISNTGSKAESDIRLTCTLPDKMEFKGAQGPTAYQEDGKTLVFQTLAKLAPRTDAVYRLNVKATAPGDLRFKVQVTSANLVEPVVESEATRVYSDTPDGRP